MSDERFDVKATEQELRDIRRRTKVLKRGAAKHLRSQLSALLLAVSTARDAEKLLADIAAFLDEAEEA
jgi:hypothetical protein